MNLIRSDSLISFMKTVKNCSGDCPADRSAVLESISERWDELGLRRGDVVIIALPNGVELLQHLFGLLEVGGVPVLVSPSNPFVRLEEILRAFGARAIIAPRLRSKGFETWRLAAIDKVEVAIFEPTGPPPTAPGEMILLTSGTSGFASGCVFDLSALMLNAKRHADSINLQPGDKMLVNLPLHYSYALVAQVFAALERGAHLLISGPPFHIPSYLSTLFREKITISSMTPILARTLVQNGFQVPECLRVLTVGGDVLEPLYVERLLRLRPDRELYMTYGLTEAGPRVSTLAAHLEDAQRLASVGLPLPGTKIRLDESSAPGGEKELLVSSDTLMKRRIGLVEGRRGADWRGSKLLATGDLFDQDKNGYLYFKARLSDFMMKDGEKICLASVRRIANSLPGVILSKTNVRRDDNGKSVFDLTLLITPVSEESGGNLQKELYRLLSRSERPRSINVVVAESESITAVK